MKGPQVAGLIWLANLLVVAGAAFAGYSYWTSVTAEQRSTRDRAMSPKTKEKLIAWKNQADNVDLDGHAGLSRVLLSPQQRPPDVSISPGGSTLRKSTTLTGKGGSGNPTTYQWSLETEGELPKGVSLSTTSGRSTMLQFSKVTPKDAQVTVRVVNGVTGEDSSATYTLSFDEKVVPTITDEMLRKELEEWVNQKFTLLRLLYGPPSLAQATVMSKEAGKLYFRAGLKFKEEYKDSNDPKAKGLARHDVEVLSIESDHVLMKGQSRNPQYKDKYFEVKLKMDPMVLQKPKSTLGKRRSPRGSNGSAVSGSNNTKPEPSPTPVDTRPKESYQDDSGNWTLGTNDMNNIKVNDLAKYVRVVTDRNGKPLGIQVTDEMPDDNIALARGAKKGDIIKAINGQAVKSMSDVRGIVAKQRKAGETKFEVTYERDGIEGTKVFTAPAKKNK